MAEHDEIGKRLRVAGIGVAVAIVAATWGYRQGPESRAGEPQEAALDPSLALLASGTVADWQRATPEDRDWAVKWASLGVRGFLTSGQVQPDDAQDMKDCFYERAADLAAEEAAALRVQAVAEFCALQLGWLDAGVAALRAGTLADWERAPELEQQVAAIEVAAEIRGRVEFDVLLAADASALRNCIDGHVARLRTDPEFDALEVRVAAAACAVQLGWSARR